MDLRRNFRRMFILYVVFEFLFIATQLRCLYAQVTTIIVEEEQGYEVATTSLSFIHYETGILDKIQLDFLLRVACVESNYGDDTETYRDGYHGGIWQIDETIFVKTKDTTTYSLLNEKYQEVAKLYDIAWISVEWSDLRKPLYSAIAATLYLAILTEVVPPVADLDGQASYWRRHFDTGSADVVERENYFKAGVANCQEKFTCEVPALYIVFVMDGSGSIGPSDFNISKVFVANTIDAFQIGENKTRIGVIQYESTVYPEITLGAENNKTTVKSRVQDIVYRSGGTHTGSAIDYMVTNSDFFGGSEIDQTSPRIGIVITDGKSGDDVLGPSERARENGITLFAVGVGGYDIDELNEIANDPDDVYSFEVKNFAAIDNIRNTLVLTACLESEKITDFITGEKKSLSDTTPPGGIKYLEIPIPESGEMTFTLNLTGSKNEGSQACAYLSTLLPNPNSAFYEWKVCATNGGPPVQVFIDVSDKSKRRRKRQTEQEVTLYVSIENTGETDNHFTVIAEEGDTVVEIPTTVSPVTTSLPTTASISTEIPTTDVSPVTSSLPTTASISTDMGVGKAINNPNTGVSTGSTVAIVIVVLMVIIVAVVLVVFVLCRKSRKQSDSPGSADDVAPDMTRKGDDTGSKDDQVAIHVNENKGLNIVSYTKTVDITDEQEVETKDVGDKEMPDTGSSDNNGHPTNAMTVRKEGDDVKASGNDNTGGLAEETEPDADLTNEDPKLS